MTNKMEAAANDFANARDTDVLVYNGPISAPMARGFETLVVGRRRRKNCALFLCTGGGDADAAYRIARCLQRSYGHVTVHVCGWCKSAGTLIAIGAHTVAMTDGGELGPLDVQVGKKDELFETDSGLTVLAAITALENKAFDLFENAFLSLKGRSNGRITLKTATELATKLSIGIITPIMEQIDPMHVGSVTRAMEIGVEYGTRLAGLSGNLKDGAIDKLANAYPAHSFVIDRVEAETLFNEVRLLDEDELALISVFGDARLGSIE